MYDFLIPCHLLPVLFIMSTFAAFPFGVPSAAVLLCYNSDAIPLRRGSGRCGSFLRPLLWLSFCPFNGLLCLLWVVVGFYPLKPYLVHFRRCVPFLIS